MGELVFTLVVECNPGSFLKKRNQRLHIKSILILMKVLKKINVFFVFVIMVLIIIIVLFVVVFVVDVAVKFLV